MHRCIHALDRILISFPLLQAPAEPQQSNTQVKVEKRAAKDGKKEDAKDGDAKGAKTESKKDS